jgi:DNA segregation ATPase FtsK/SpoIIIE, S-DNA-T family
MSASAKTQSDGHAKGRRTRRREITGILLLALGVFAGLSLLSMQLGDGRMMGPGGAATAAGLYAAAGMTAYLLIAAMLFASVRCFRARPLVDGIVEGLAAMILLGSVAVLLHLSFAESVTAHHGPGGLLGQWLGEVAASFIGVVGAALAATTLLLTSLLLLTEISVREVMVVVVWALRHARTAVVAGALATWRVLRAAFPEKDDRTDDRNVARDGDGEGDDREGGDGPIVIEPQRAGARGPDDDGVPLPMPEEVSEGVRVGEARTLVDPISDERAGIAAVVAEVAAAEQIAAPPSGPDPADLDDVEALPAVSMPGGATDDEAELAASAEPGTAPRLADGPIIVEPASRARLRDDLEREAAELAAPREAAADGPGFIKLTGGAYQLPGTELLEYLPPQGHDMDKQALYDMAERLEQAMANYGVRGKVKEIHMGPVVTMYEFAPAPGTRTGKIANLEKDLAMALEAQAVRIVAPIPGKAVVGVEVPNKTRETVYLKEILEDETFSGASSRLQIALGKDIKGAPVTVNLAKMPHLLVAGTTGSGKSVAVNGMIASLLYNASPEEVRFIMVDPKMLELSIYEGIPHLLLPVVTDPKKANLALRWAVDEMERRYELLAKTGVRDIASYNARIDLAVAKASGGAPPAAADGARAATAKKIRVVIAGPDGSEQEVDLETDAEIPVAAERADTNPDGIVEAETPSDEDLSDAAAKVQAARDGASGEPLPRKLPYVVIVIDEFADLMMVAPKDVETSVARIAQKARAAGLHLILATQRPSVDVITGLIKANFPSRIALQVASKIDSRTILDQSGAETLLGNGDMLFSDRGTKLRRIHGAFLSDDEVHRVVDFLKKQAKPVYDMEILKPRDEDGENGGAPADDFHDDFYDQAVAIVCETRQASVSYIQRRLQIGYNRSARLVEQMERDGIVGPANGAKPREVLAPPGEYLQNAG